MAQNNAINLRYDLGSTDQSILRTDGTGGNAMDALSTATLDDNGRLTTPTGSNGGFYFGDGDTGFYESSDDVVRLSIATADSFEVNSNGDADFLGSGATKVQSGTTGERPGTPANGMIRYNSDNSVLEVYAGGSWQDLASGAISGSTGATDNAVIRADGTGGSTLQASDVIIDDSANISGLLSLAITGISGSFSGSDFNIMQAGVQTTDATVTQIASIAVNSNEAIVVKAYFMGFRSTFAEACGGELVYVARRAGAGAVEVSTPVKNKLEDSSGAPDIDADVSGNNVRLLVQGEGSKTFNWVVTYMYHRVQTNA